MTDANKSSSDAGPIDEIFRPRDSLSEKFNSLINSLANEKSASRQELEDKSMIINNIKTTLSFVGEYGSIGSAIYWYGFVSSKIQAFIDTYGKNNWVQQIEDFLQRNLSEIKNKLDGLTAKKEFRTMLKEII